MGIASKVRAARAWFLKDYVPGNRLPLLETSWDVRVSIRRLREHEWRALDLQWAFFIPVLFFCFCIADSPPLIVRLLLVAAVIGAALVPALSRFVLGVIPTATYLILFFSCRYIPNDWRPSIYVRVLPALETILYGNNLSAVLSESTNSVLDVLAWIPYGLGHFSIPVIVSFVFFLFGPPGILPVWSLAFGTMNTLGVMTQIMFPNAPPWYQELHGLSPANYGMSGSPGGLERIDTLLGLNLYGGTFGASPMVFGAFPSLHSGSATMEAFFLSHLFPRYSPLFFGYVMWMWWSTMYLTHHYFVDLIGGACLSFAVFYGVKVTILPRVQADKLTRWAYEYVEIGVGAQSRRTAKFRKSIDDEGYSLDNVSTAATTPLDSDVEMGLVNEHHIKTTSLSGITTGLGVHRSGTPSPVDDSSYFGVRSASPARMPAATVTVAAGGTGLAH